MRLPLVRERLQRQGIKSKTQQIILGSWRTGTAKQYKVYLRKWHEYAVQNEKDPIYSTVGDILDFMTDLFEAGIGYSAINTARAALASAVELTDSLFSISTHPLIIRFLKGVFQVRPTLPRYTFTWDVATVFQYLKGQSPAHKITLKMLSLKLVMLCLLVTGCRGQTIRLLDISCMCKGKSAYIFNMEDLVKQSRPGKKQPQVELHAYPADRRLCVYTYMTEYLSRTGNLRGAETRLFVSYTRPHKPIGADTVSRWVKATLTAAGIDTKLFKPHSTRSASSSAAASKDTPLDTILSTVGWSSSAVFAKYYKKHINKENTYGANVLSSCG